MALNLSHPLTRPQEKDERSEIGEIQSYAKTI